MVMFFDQGTLREGHAPCSLMGKLEPPKASKGCVLPLPGCRWRIWSRRIQHWKNIVGEKNKGGKEFFYCDALLSQEWQPKRGSSVQGPVEQLVLPLGCRGVPWSPYRSCPHHLISLHGHHWPLSWSRTGNLVVCDYGRRYPEAVSLKNIDSEHVAEELLKVFLILRVGISSEILADQGANFMSKLLT